MNTRPYRDIERMFQMREEGKTLQQIGNEFGLTRERIRQILKEEDPKYAARLNWRRRELKEEQERIQRETEAHKAGAWCLVCGTLVLRKARGHVTLSQAVKDRNGFNLTCSSTCARKYEVVKLQVNPQAWYNQRISYARSILRNAESRTGAEVRWAKRFLAGEATSRGRWTTKESKVRKTLDRERVTPYYEEKRG